MQFWAAVKSRRLCFLSQKCIGGLAQGRKDLPLSLSLFSPPNLLLNINLLQSLFAFPPLTLTCLFAVSDQ